MIFAMKSYEASEVEKKWQTRWRESGIFRADLANPGRPKYYNVTMFPYPSGDKLHIGHWYNYGPVDTWGRYMKMKGFEVFQPMGFDSFGLPAENYAIKTGVHPAKTTRTNIDYMKKQIEAIGGMFDLDVNLETSSPEYYKWTQWVFLKLYEKGLAYRKEAPVNWCPSCMTVLANEQVEDGKCERCKSDVVQKNLRQWFFAITKYVDQLLDYEGLDWPEKTVLMQKHWIGRSEGLTFKQKVKDLDIEFETYNSVPQMAYADTFYVIAPEHPLVAQLAKGTEHEKKVLAFVEDVKKRKMANKFDVEGALEGIFTGRYVEDPLGNGDLPIWIASYVVADYGTGIVKCSAHDERDFNFARKYDIPLKVVLVPTDLPRRVRVESFVEFFREEDGVLLEPKEFAGLTYLEAREPMMKHLEGKGLAKRTVNYRLRDWLISRQRYWGAPIPIINCEKCGEVAVPEKDLPVVHPHIEDYVPKGTSPLATVAEFVNVKCPKCGGPGKREVDTMDTFVCSSWYFLRYPDAANAKEAWSKKKVDTWMPVDMYIGGPEHACMHLLYARFIHRVMHDLGYVSTKEPFKRLVHQGMVTKDGAKMSKSKGNVVSPDEFVAKYGSDIFRMYLMFMGPFTEGGDWNDRGITGVARFVERFYRMMQVEDGASADMNGLVHKTVARCSDAVEKMNFNIVIAALMELTNEALQKPLNKDQKELVVRVLAPLAPHLAEEVWENLGHKKSIFLEQWPKADPAHLKEDKVTFAIQVNGKLRGTVDLAPDVSKEDALASARAFESVAKHLTGTVVKEIFVPGRIIGFVVKG